MIFISFILFLLIVIILVVKKYRKILTEEDNYQKQRNKIYSPIVSRIELYKKDDYNQVVQNMQIDKFSKMMEDIKKSNFNLNPNDIIDKNIKTHIFDVLFDDDNLHIYYMMNHEYIGGGTFLKGGNKSFNENSPVCYKSNVFLGLLLLPKFLIHYPIPNIKNPIPINDKIQRFCVSTSYKKEQIGNLNTRAFVLKQILDELYISLSLDRPLYYYLPVAFETLCNVKNNVGVIFLSYIPSYSVQDLTKQLEQNKYQAIVTNSILLTKINKFFKSDGKNIRSKVDAVITMGYTDSPQYRHDLFWTYLTAPEYPIYVASYSMNYGNETGHSLTYTVSTDNFKKSERMKIMDIPQNIKEF